MAFSRGAQPVHSDSAPLASKPSHGVPCWGCFALCCPWPPRAEKKRTKDYRTGGSGKLPPLSVEHPCRDSEEEAVQSVPQALQATSATGIAVPDTNETVAAAPPGPRLQEAVPEVSNVARTSEKLVQEDRGQVLLDGVSGKLSAGHVPELRRQSSGGSCHMNGFRIKPEVESIQVALHNVAPFSLPQEAFSFEPDARTVVTPFQNGDRERLIHCNTKLEPEEQRLLKSLQKEASRQGKSFLPSISVAATRFISDARGDVTKALAKMQSTQDWRLDYFRAGPIVDETLMEDLKLGVIYFCGRDRMLRPTLVVRPARAPLDLFNVGGVQKLTRAIVFCMEYFVRYMTIPGKVENLNVILDLKGLAIRQVPLNALLQIRSVMSLAYTGRVYRFYICNMTWMMQTIAGIVQAAMTDRQREKIVFVKGATELRREFALHHLEADLGGNRPEVTEFFPFPLQAGPFSGGHPGGPRTGAVPGMHAVLTRDGVRGRLWDPRASVQSNTRLEFSERAADLLLACRGLESLAAEAEAAQAQLASAAALAVGAVPNPQEQELPAAADGPAVADQGLASETDHSTASEPSSLDQLDSTKDDAAPSVLDGVVMEETAVVPCCYFSCFLPCGCGTLQLRT